jgi:hypothetical protein
VRIILIAIAGAFLLAFLLGGSMPKHSDALEKIHSKVNEEYFSVYRKSVIHAALNVSGQQQLQPLLAGIDQVENVTLEGKRNNKAMLDEFETGLKAEGYEVLLSMRAGSGTDVLWAKSPDSGNIILNPVYLKRDTTSSQLTAVFGEVDMNDAGTLSQLMSLRDFATRNDWIQTP